MSRNFIAVFSLSLALGFLLGCATEKDTKTLINAKPSPRPGELLHFDFERKENGSFPNLSNQLYFGKIVGGPEIVEGKNGRGLFFSKAKQSVEICGPREMLFGSFNCEFDIKPLKSGSKGWLLYGPSSWLHREGFGIRLRKDERLEIIYSTKSNPSDILIASEKLPLNVFTDVRVVYDEKTPSLTIYQNQKIVAKRDLKEPILFNSKGAASMRIGVGFDKTPLNIVLDEFKFVATSKPKVKQKAIAKKKKKNLDVFIQDQQEFKGGGLTVGFKAAKDYGFQEKELFYGANRIIEDGKPLKPRMMTTALGFTGIPYNRFLEDEEKKVVLELSNETAKKKEITLKTTVEDWRDKRVWERKKTVVLPPKGKSEVVVDLETGQKGCFFINFICLENGGKISEYNTSYAITVDSSRAVKDPESSPFGQHFHEGFGSDRKRQISGANWTRYYRRGAGWADIELEPDKYDWDFSDKALDYMIDKCGHKVLYTVMYTPHFYSTMPLERYHATSKNKRASYRSFHPPKNLEPWKKWIREMVKRRKDRVKHWEIWNEVNADYFLGSMEQYFELLKSAYETIKAEDPDAIVAGGALTGDFIEHAKKLFELGGHKYMDVLTVHYYLQKAPEKEILLPMCRQTKELIAQTGKDLPVWNGESSYCVPLRDKNCRIKPVPYGSEKLQFCENGGCYETPGERRAAAYSIRQRILELGLGIDRFFTFTRMSTPPGAYTLNLVAREAMVKNIGDKKFKRNIDLGAKHLWGRLFSGSEGNTAVLWSSGGEQDLILDCDKDEIIISDFLGNTRKTSGRNCKITVSGYPVYVLGCGPKINVGNKLFSLKKLDERGLIGENFNISISNRHQDPLQLKLSLSDSLDRKAGENIDISLPGGASKTVVLAIDPKAKAGDGEIAIVSVDAAGKKLRHSFPIRLAPAPISVSRTKLTSPNQSPPDLKGNVSMDTEEQVKIGRRDPSFIETVPHWRNANDVSAQTTLAWNSKGLYLSVDVTDDHFLPDSNEKPYLNDSVELFLDLRKSPGEGNYGPGVFHFLVRLLPNGDTEIKDYAPGAGTKLNINAKWRKSAKGYELSAFIKIPAKFKLQVGREIGFDLAVNDADSGRNGNKRVSQIVWRGEADNYINASRFGLVKLK